MSLQMRHIEDNKGILLECLAILIILLIAFFIFGKLDVLEKIVALSRAYEEYEIDEIVSTAFVFAVLLSIFSYRRLLDIKQRNHLIDHKN